MEHVPEAQVFPASSEGFENGGRYAQKPQKTRVFPICQKTRVFSQRKPGLSQKAGFSLFVRKLGCSLRENPGFPYLSESPGFSFRENPGYLRKPGFSLFVIKPGFSLGENLSQKTRVFSIFHGI